MHRKDVPIVFLCNPALSCTMLPNSVRNSSFLAVGLIFFRRRSCPLILVWAEHLSRPLLKAPYNLPLPASSYFDTPTHSRSLQGYTNKNVTSSGAEAYDSTRCNKSFSEVKTTIKIGCVDRCTCLKRKLLNKRYA